MRNFLFLILIIVAIVGIFFIFQKSYPQQEETNTNQTESKTIDNSNTASTGTKVLEPTKIIFTESAPFYLVDEAIQASGEVNIRHNSIDMYELNLQANLPQPEDQIYVAWLTGGINPDSYIYLGQLEKQTDLSYTLDYKKLELYEQFFAYHIVIVSLENNDGELPDKPTVIKLKADLR